MVDNTFKKLKENKKLALTLEGGGARGAYQIGALKALFENGYKFNAIVGTSIGAINGAYVVQGDFDKLYEMWKTMSFKDLFNLDNDAMAHMLNIDLDKETIKYLSKKVGDSIKNKGLDVTAEKQILENDIDEEKIRNSNILYGLVTMCVSNIKGEELYINEIPNGKLVDYLMASSNLPIFKRVVIDDKKYLDGGAWDNCPVHMLEQKGYTDVIIIRAHKRIRIRDYKEIIKRGRIRLHMICPVDTLPSILNFDTNNLNYQIEWGYYDALREINGLDGFRYYIKPVEEKDIIKILKSAKISDVAGLMNEYYIKLNVGENILQEGIEKLVIKLGTKTKNKEVYNIKDAFISILEEIALVNNIERFKIYSLNELIDEVKKCKVSSNKYIDFGKFIKILEG